VFLFARGETLLVHPRLYALPSSGGEGVASPAPQPFKPPGNPHAKCRFVEEAAPDSTSFL